MNVIDKQNGKRVGATLAVALNKQRLFNNNAGDGKRRPYMFIAHVICRCIIN